MPREQSAETLARGVLRGERRALARLITQVENRTPEAAEALATLHPHTGNAYVVGITGAPGTGKSTLVNALTQALRARGQKVGIIAVDPTSPFSGGAVLGDRIRMGELTGDRGVFIRSMANRGSLGGLAAATGDVARVLDAAGFDVVLIETVGAGQSEVEIAGTAHTTVVVEAPGLGDDVQAIKAGILEIADVLVVNKADRPGAEHTVRALQAMLSLGHRLRTVNHHGQGMGVEETPAVPEYDFWDVPIVQTVATEGEGVVALLDALAQHRAYLQQSGGWQARERARVEADLRARLREALLARLLAERGARAFETAVEHVLARELSPEHAVRVLLNGR